jgi:hypothetical protein
MERPTFVRYLPTPSSERFLLQLDGQAAALLERIDEILLPEVRLDDKTLTFTVAIGRVVGAYAAERG